MASQIAASAPLARCSTNSPLLAAANSTSQRITGASRNLHLSVAGSTGPALTEENDHVSSPITHATQLPCQLGARHVGGPHGLGSRQRVEPVLAAAGRGGGQRLDPPLPRQLPGGRTRRSPPAHRRSDPVARPGNGRRDTNRKACSSRRCRSSRAIGRRTTTGARCEATAQRAAEVHHRDRRARHSFHPRPLEA